MKILLDTSFLLPTAGIKVDNPLVPRVLHKLSSLSTSAQIYFTEINLLEMTWTYLKVMKKIKETSDHQLLFQVGLESIIDRYMKAGIPPKAFINAIRLKHKGHPDLIDCLLYETAKASHLLLVTLDEELFHFLEKEDLATDSIILAKDFLD